MHLLCVLLLLFFHIIFTDAVRLVNDMLSQLHVTTRVQHWSDINAAVFVTLYEGLCGDKLPGNIDISMLLSVRDK